MSKQVFSSSKIAKSYQISNSSHGYNENQKNYYNGINQSIPKTRIAATFQKNLLDKTH